MARLDPRGPALGLVSPSKSGAMVMPLISLGTSAPGEGLFWAAPLPIYATGTLDRIGCEITAPGSTGAVIRLGIYRLATNGVDLSLVLDAGTVDGTQAAGTYSITINQAVTPGIYVIGLAVQGGATTRPTLRYGQSPATHLINRTTAIGSAASHGLSFTAAGALPATATVSSITSAPAVYVRWA